MFFRKKIDTSINYLELTPVRNYDHVIEENGLVSVFVPKFDIKWLDNIMSKIIKSRFFKAKLDEFGTATWLEMDGNKSVQLISEHLSKKFGEKINPVDERLTKFLSELYKYNFITFKELNTKGN
jgi:Coenzyme PQQ synthesis protein D (PqqD)